jgi:2-oxoisovalerate dehydrogenase E2 component (dihydrolipoyl transacylase)
MPQSFALPDVGEGLTEAEIVEWRVAVGDAVTINQTLCEIETAKAVAGLPSPYAGVVTEILHGPGDIVAVGRPIVVIADDAAEATRRPAPDPPNDASADAPERAPVLVGYGVHPNQVARRPRKPEPAQPPS